MKKMLLLLLLILAASCAQADDNEPNAPKKSPISIKKVGDKWLVLDNEDPRDGLAMIGNRPVYFSNGLAVVDTLENIDTSIAKNDWTRIYMEKRIVLSKDSRPPRPLKEDFFLRHAIDSWTIYGSFENSSIIKRTESSTETGFAWEVVAFLVFLLASAFQLIFKRHAAVTAPLSTIGSVFLASALVIVLISMPETGWVSGAMITLAPPTCALALLCCRNLGGEKIMEKTSAISNIIGLCLIVATAFIHIVGLAIISSFLIASCFVIRFGGVKKTLIRLRIANKKIRTAKPNLDNTI